MQDARSLLSDCLEQRRARLAALRVELELDAIVLDDRSHALWLGWPQLDCVMVDGDRPLPFSTQALLHTIQSATPMRIGVGATMSASLLLALQNACPQAQWLALGPELQRMRQVKDAVELAVLRRANQLAETGLAAISELVAEGVSELDLMHRADWAIREAGGDGFAFDPSIGAGERSPLMWAGVSTRVLKAGEVVLVDLGAMYRGYRSDLARTFIVPGGERSDVLAAISAVRETIDYVCGLIRPGVVAGDLHAAAVEALRAYRGAMPTCLGHGVGLEVHESPALCHGSDARLVAGMVLAIEPSVYLDSTAGVRWEVMVHVTEDGCERL